ncbi:hypothetical protein K7J14_12385 [Treponema zuelzerae]|uniref:Uncharacterized protein n=1 Tax=Teretinema zuelzerae TaxID=156 RepID=A0AAE3EL33_9SPIR|nr:hypothetical protein [Teretinema zuelzerae]MBN2810925.1 hypothetical protein [Spirochaetales bacterium]MCD1655493.1 hypothetical protein [Teretinema zuelzerae]
MTELQPTEIELTNRKKPSAGKPRKRVIFLVSVLVIILIVTVLTGILANQASRDPSIVQPGELPVAETPIAP